MIFVTMGSSKIAPMYDFAKEIDKIAAGFDDEFIVQYGVSKIDYKHVTAYDYLDKQSFKYFLAQADIVVSQGGWGGLSECIDIGKPLVAVPRKFGVEVNHDQEQLVRKLEQMGCLLGVYDINDLEAQIRKASQCRFNSLPRVCLAPEINEHIRSWFG